MTEYMISAVSETTIVPDLRSMLESGQLEAYRVRSNGTTRLVRLLPVGSTGRDTAEWISEQIDEGRTAQSVARELHSSVPTIRRFLEALELTEEIEAGDWDEVWAELNGFSYATPADELTNEELASVFTEPVENTASVDAEPTNA